MNQLNLNNLDIRQIRCSSCGRFMGLGYIQEGVVVLWCKQCKRWTLVLGETAEKDLTGQQIIDMMTGAGQKVREGQKSTEG